MSKYGNKMPKVEPSITMRKTSAMFVIEIKTTDKRRALPGAGTLKNKIATKYKYTLRIN